MATIKSYTDIEQSKKLADILPKESADMFYATETSTLIAESPYEVEGYKPCIPFIPCWSLAALLNVLPKETRLLKSATKEQRNILFKAITDAGYTFDFEKKVIKKRN